MAVDPQKATYPLTVFFHPACGDTADAKVAQGKAGADKVVLVDITAAGFDASKHGLPAENANATTLFAKDAAGVFYTGSDALYAAYNASGLGNYFKYVRLPGFRSTVGGAKTTDGKLFGAR